MATPITYVKEQGNPIINVAMLKTTIWGKVYFLKNEAQQDLKAPAL